MTLCYWQQSSVTSTAKCSVLQHETLLLTLLETRRQEIPTHHMRHRRCWSPVSERATVKMQDVKRYMYASLLNKACVKKWVFSPSLNCPRWWRLSGAVLEVSSRRLELWRENSVDWAESWWEEPTCHVVKSNAGASDQRWWWLPCRCVWSRYSQCC